MSTIHTLPDTIYVFSFVCFGLFFMKIRKHGIIIRKKTDPQNSATNIALIVYCSAKIESEFIVSVAGGTAGEPGRVAG